MIVVFKLTPDVYRRIKEFIEKGTYDSVENFVEIALINQLQLEEQEISSIGRSKESASSQELEDVGVKPRQVKQQIRVQAYAQFLGFPKNASLQVVQSQPLTDETKNSPLWGQINRLAPVKFVLRILANNITLSGDNRIDLKHFSADVAENATLTRIYIEKKDKTQRVRGEELYVGFPKKDPGSQQRFINFYVGKLPRGKWTDGVLTGLSLARIDQTEEGSVMIGLTEAGREFACLHSPLIDDFLLGGKQVENPFSHKEVDFLLRHIKSLRSGEYEYLTSALGFIRNGANTPNSLNEKISNLLRDKLSVVKVTDKVVNTMQVGATGRLVELRLVRIEKDGLRSKYSVTNDGKNLLNSEVKR